MPERRRRIWKCPSCGERLKPLRYYVNTKDKKGWVKVGYYCPKEKKFYSLEEIEGSGVDEE